MDAEQRADPKTWLVPACRNAAAEAAGNANDGARSMIRPDSRLVSALALALVPLACKSDPAAPATGIEISPASVQLDIGETAQLHVEVRDAAGSPLQGRPVSWSSVDTRIAAAENEGLVRGLATGRTRIQATVDGLTAEAVVNVVPPGGILRRLAALTSSSFGD